MKEQKPFYGKSAVTIRKIVEDEVPLGSSVEQARSFLLKYKFVITDSEEKPLAIPLPMDPDFAGYRTLQGGMQNRSFWYGKYLTRVEFIFSNEGKLVKYDVYELYSTL